MDLPFIRRERIARNCFYRLYGKRGNWRVELYNMNSDKYFEDEFSRKNDVKRFIKEVQEGKGGEEWQ